MGECARTQGVTSKLSPVMAEGSGRGLHRQRGFTLLELLVVLVILGLLSAFAAPQVLKYLGSARADAARLQIENLAGVLDLYRLETGRYPNAEEGLPALVKRPAGAPRWTGPYLRRPEMIQDPWGRDYIYRIPGSHGPYDLSSLGADGAEGGEGEDRDVTSW